MFGTDGIRGPANVHPMLPEVAMRVGMAVGRHFGRGGSVVIGKDTRRSGYMFETALASGLTAVGARVMLVGPMPTPGIAYITRSMRASAGVVISASHNPFEDNGIKIFGADGFKLPDAVELELESLAEAARQGEGLAAGAEVGTAWRIDDAAGRYITHAKQAFVEEGRLAGLKIVVDCAHGAAYKVAPAVLAELGAEVIALGVSPNGVNINDGVGALHPGGIAREVKARGATLGIALDGDADRVVFVDESGELVDGDAVLAILGIAQKGREELPHDTVVGTAMANLGLERALGRVGVKLLRTKVGDRYVVEAMRAGGYTLGGEQSGHVICLDHSTTGDGIVTALQVLSVMHTEQRPLSELAACMERIPQLTRSFRVASKPALASLSATTALIDQARKELEGAGRVLVRYSGTEAKLRVMVESERPEDLESWVGRIGDAAVAEIGAA